MLVRGAELFFELLPGPSGGSERIRCAVVQASEELVRLQFIGEAPALEIGDRGRAYFEAPEGFGYRELAVREISRNGHECLIRLTGEMQPAPTREFFRVCVQNQDLWCAIDGQRCRITSLSPGGLGVVSTQGYGIGELVELALYDGVRSAIGRVRVVNRGATDGGATAYGLRLAPGVIGDGSRLGETLSRMCTEVQLRELRELRDQADR